MRICKDFLVVPPAGPLFEGPEFQNAVLASLTARFPEYKWEVYDGPDEKRHEHFSVVPSRSALLQSDELIGISVKSMQEFDEFLNFQFIEPTKRIN